MGIFKPIRTEAYRLPKDLRLQVEQHGQETELKFSSPLEIKAELDPDRSHPRQSPNVLYALLEREAPEFVGKFGPFYVSAFSYVRGDWFQNNQLEIEYFHQDPEFETKGGFGDAWRKAILQFTSYKDQDYVCCSVLDKATIRGGTLRGYVGLPLTVDFFFPYNRSSETVASVLRTLLYGQELDLYPCQQKEPFYCTPGEADLRIRVAHPTVKRMKKAMQQAQEISAFVEEQQGKLRPLIKEVETVRREYADKERNYHCPRGRREEGLLARIMHSCDGPAREKLKRTGEQLHRLSEGFPKEIVQFAPL